MGLVTLYPINNMLLFLIEYKTLNRPICIMSRIYLANVMYFITITRDKPLSLSKWQVTDVFSFSVDNEEQKLLGKTLFLYMLQLMSILNTFNTVFDKSMIDWLHAEFECVLVLTFSLMKINLEQVQNRLTFQSVLLVQPHGLPSRSR